jgi:hypothetical protein
MMSNTIDNFVKSMSGKMHINFQENVGTEIVLTFPKSDIQN